MHTKKHQRELRNMIQTTPLLLDHTYARTTPVEMETPRSIEDNRVKIPRPPKREEPKPPVKDLETELEVGTRPITPVKDSDSIPVARSQHSPKLRQAPIKKPVKEVKVLLPVKRPEHPEPVRPDPMNEEIPLDFESAINTHTVIKPELEKKRKGKKQRKTFGLAAKPPAIRNGERRKKVLMKREDIINCHCGYRGGNGLMVQCDLCLCWQHAMCHNMQRECDVPEKYTCSICLNPRRGRRSQRFLNDHDTMYEARLPGSNPCEINRRSYELSANLLKIKHEIHALKVQCHMASKKDHPKLHLCAKDRERTESQPRHNIPQQEDRRNGQAALQPEAPKLNAAQRRQVLENVRRCQAGIDVRLDSIEAEIEDLESQSFGDGETPSYCSIKETIKMLMRDLETMEELGIIT